MATIDYKQKIKDYMNSSEVDTLYKSMLNNLFPELAESEDERIRKELIEFVKSRGGFKQEYIAWIEEQGQVKESPISQHENKTCKENDDSLTSEDERISKHLLYHFRNKTKEEWNGMPVKDIIAYLEKQEQHKKFRDSIQVGDKVTKNEDGVLVNLSQLNRVAKKDENQGEQKPVYPLAHEKMETERWKEACKAACSDRNYRSHYGLTETRDDYFVDGVHWADEHPEQKPVEWSEEDKRMLDEIVDFFENGTVKLQHDLSLYASWLKSLRPQPKQEWSKEDVEMIDRLIRHCEKEHEELCNDRYGHQEIVSDLKSSCRERWNWLKSLKDRVQPKQEWSEEDERRFNNLCFLINQSDENVPTKEGFINWLKSFCHHKHNHTSWWYECIKECVGFKVGNVYNSDGEWIYGDNKKCAYDERFFHPQSHWKPSDEQMKALQTAIGIVGELTPTASLLKEIREQLKKLWEE